MSFSMTGQKKRWHINKGDWLIEVTAWAGSIVYIMYMYDDFLLNRSWWSSEKFSYCRIHWSSLPLQSTWWSDRGGDRWRHHDST